MKHYIRIFPFLLFALLHFSCSAQKKEKDTRVNLTPPPGRAIAAFAEGCFWCSEHIYDAVVGVDSVISGYAGGNVANPSYELVNTETTGHAETILVYYDPKLVSYKDLVEVFFSSQDPTTLNRQGPDRGTSYRSILFYRGEQEKAIAEQAKIDFQKNFKRPIVTEIKELKAFYRAEDYHQNYVEQNPNNPYISGVSVPRFILFKKTYKGDKLKK